MQPTSIISNLNSFEYFLAERAARIDFIQRRRRGETVEQILAEPLLQIQQAQTETIEHAHEIAQLVLNSSRQMTEPLAEIIAEQTQIDPTEAAHNSIQSLRDINAQLNQDQQQLATRLNEVREQLHIRTMQKEQLNRSVQQLTLLVKKKEPPQNASIRQIGGQFSHSISYPKGTPHGSH